MLNWQFEKSSEGTSFEWKFTQGLGFDFGRGLVDPDGGWDGGNKVGCGT